MWSRKFILTPSNWWLFAMHSCFPYFSYLSLNMNSVWQNVLVFILNENEKFGVNKSPEITSHWFWKYISPAAHLWSYSGERYSQRRRLSTHTLEHTHTHTHARTHTHIQARTHALLSPIHLVFPSRKARKIVSNSFKLIRDQRHSYWLL